MRLTGQSFATRSEVMARRGMVATSQPLAVQTALMVLRGGGNAVDAAIAANAALTVVEPTGCGLGGDLFALVWQDGEKRLYGLNASGRSPRRLDADQLRRRGLSAIPVRGPLSITVPGVVDGWRQLNRRFGSLPMAELLQPAIDYAREGFPVSEVIASCWGRDAVELESYPNFAATFLPQGRAPGKGEVFRNPDLARTLEHIARHGPDTFYQGDLAHALDSFCQQNECFLRLDDLQEHRSTWVSPVSIPYRGFDIWEMPPNTQGLTVLQMLGMLRDCNLKGMGHNSAAYLHHLIEAKKIAFEDRARFYADPEFSHIPIRQLLSDDYIASRRELLDPAKASISVPHSDLPSDGDTVYLTVSDQRRTMVSLIQSNYLGFGSGLVPAGMGFGLQNRGALFSLKPGHPNRLQPRKRPFHTIIPAFVTQAGEPRLSFGVMGGDMQPQGHVQILCNIIDFGMNVQEAGDAARFFHTGSSTPTGRPMEEGGTVFLEAGIPAAVRLQLLEKGHRLSFGAGLFGGYQAIAYDAGQDVYRAGSDPRKDGLALGF